jgi:hypothetical protein
VDWATPPQIARLARHLIADDNVTTRVDWEVMRRAIAGLWTLLLLVSVAAAGQTLPASAAAEKLETTWSFLRARNARDYAVATPNAIGEARYTEVGGIQQWITIRGEDRNNPVLLFLHGGPGAATNPWGYAGFRLWLKHFTVVQWDQRGAGRTFGKNRNAPAEAITVARMMQDGIELADVAMMRSNCSEPNAYDPMSATVALRVSPRFPHRLVDGHIGNVKAGHMPSALRQHDRVTPLTHRDVEHPTWCLTLDKL